MIIMKNFKIQNSENIMDFKYTYMAYNQKIYLDISSEED